MTTSPTNSHNWSERMPTEARALATELLDAADTFETLNVEDTTNDINTLPDYFDPVIDTINHARLIAWDGCHKIYLATDDSEADRFRRDYNGEDHDCTFEGTPKEMLNLLVTWWNNSCELKFIKAVRTNHADPEAGYVSLIGQGDWCENDKADDDVEVATCGADSS